ncbi:MAG TPA: M48 family metalloprotease [Azospirillum sp.]|nr:M48 family metalloprotease [Azospirillum sp.]
MWSLCNPILSFIAALTLLACSSGPAPAVSSEEALGAQEHPKLVQQYGGEYRDPKVQRFVEGIGRRLAAAAGADVRWSFTVLDSDVVNAFALPGGYVHLTRGLMALAKDEAEVASVMAHEMGHVLRQHSTSRMNRSTIAGLLAAGVGMVLGSPEIAQVLGLGSNLYIASYSRGQETEADEVGVQLLQAAGYDPFAMATFLETMRRYSQYEALKSGKKKSEGFDFFATHPQTEDRVQHAADLARAAPRGGGRPVEPYMTAMNGTIWGDSPENGFVRSNAFVHPKLGIGFSVPEGFSLLNGAEQVMAKGPGGAVMVFDGGRAPGVRDPADVLAQSLQGARTQGVQRLDINGLPAATAVTQAETEQGQVDARLVTVSVGGDAVYRFTFLAPPGSLRRYDPAFRQTTMSFHRLSQNEAASYRPERIQTLPVRPGDTAEQFVARMADKPHAEELFRIINDIPPGTPVQARPMVKVIADR